MARLAAPLLAVLAVSFPAAAQAPSTNREPYDVAIRCFVANGIAVRQRRDAGDAAKAAHYENMAKKSHGIAYGFGETLGFTQARVTQDFERAVQVEAPAMRRDQDYFHRVVAQCKGYKLM